LGPKIKNGKFGNLFIGINGNNIYAATCFEWYILSTMMVGLDKYYSSALVWIY